MFKKEKQLDKENFAKMHICPLANVLQKLKKKKENDGMRPLRCQNENTTVLPGFKMCRFCFLYIAFRGTDLSITNP